MDNTIVSTMVAQEPKQPFLFDTPPSGPSLSPHLN